LGDIWGPGLQKNSTRGICWYPQPKGKTRRAQSKEVKEKTGPAKLYAEKKEAN